MTKNIARDGAAKRPTQVQPNPGMHHTALAAEPGQPGLIANGISRTRSAELLGAPTIRSGDVVGNGEKKLTPLTPHPMQNLDRVDRGHHVEGQAETVLANSVQPARTVLARKPGR